MLEHVTHDLIKWIRVLPPPSIYLVFFLIAYLENIITPLPGDFIVAFGGYLVAEGIILFIPVLLLTTVASVIGFMTVYWLGSHWGEQIRLRGKEFWVVRFISLEYIEKVQVWMGRWGQGVVVANRFLMIVRSVISLAAGMSKTKTSNTIASSFVSSILWNAILLGFGVIVHKKWQTIGYYLSVYGRVIVGLILLIILIRVGIHYYRKKRPVSTK